MALVSRVGNGALPEAAAATGGGLTWANGHPPVSIWGLFGAEDGAGASRRWSGRRAKGKGGASSTSANLNEEGSSIRGCTAARASPTELFGTVALVSKASIHCKFYDLLRTK